MPGGAPLIATDPLSYAPLFVIDTAGPLDVLRRVASLRDYAAIPVSELNYFDVRTANAQAWFDNVTAGDTLRVVEGPAHWLQEQAPYTDHDFVVQGKFIRAGGTAPSVSVGRSLLLPGYSFGPSDVGRWVRLSGFVSSGYNGLAQILSYVGNVATVSQTFTTNETGGAYQFEWVSIRPYPLGAGYEPRYFPTRASNLSWALYRDGSPLASGAGGGATMRERQDTLVRSVRFTFLAPTLDSALDSFTYVEAEMTRLQAAATLNNTAFTTLLTRTVGP